MEGNKKFNQKKILMIVGDYVEDYEAMVPYQSLLMVGHDVHVVCPNKKKTDSVITAIHDFEGEQTYSEKKGHRFALTDDFDSVKPENYDALVLPGGRAPEYLRLNETVLKYTNHFLENNKPIAAICHGIQILVSTENLKGRSLTCYPSVSAEVKLAGGSYKECKMDDVVVDKNLITAPAWPAHPKWLSKFLGVLGTTFHS